MGVEEKQIAILEKNCPFYTKYPIEIGWPTRHRCNYLLKSYCTLMYFGGGTSSKQPYCPLGRWPSIEKLVYEEKIHYDAAKAKKKTEEEEKIKALYDKGIVVKEE